MKHIPIVILISSFLLFSQESISTDSDTKITVEMISGEIFNGEKVYEDDTVIKIQSVYGVLVLKKSDIKKTYSVNQNKSSKPEQVKQNDNKNVIARTDNLVLHKASSGEKFTIQKGDRLLIIGKFGYGVHSGAFHGIKDSKILVDNKNFPIDKIKTIYVGKNPMKWKKVHANHSIVWAAILLPGSLSMDINPGARVFIWGLGSLMTSIIYAPISATIDYAMKLSNSQKFIISPYQWRVE